MTIDEPASFSGLRKASLESRTGRIGPHGAVPLHSAALRLFAPRANSSRATEPRRPAHTTKLTTCWCENPVTLPRRTRGHLSEGRRRVRAWYERRCTIGDGYGFGFLGFVSPTSGRGSATKPSRFGIFTVGKVLAFITTSSAMMPLRFRM